MSAATKKIHIVFPDREKLIDIVERENRVIKMFARLEASTSGHFNLVIEDSPSSSDTEHHQPKRRRCRSQSKKSFVDFKDSDDFNRFILRVHEYLLDLYETSMDPCLVKLRDVKTHFYEMNPPYAPKDTTIAFMNLVDKGILERVPERHLCYRVLV